MSLDGFIAGPNGEADWIVMDPDIDFGALFSRFDTVLLGRKSYEAARKRGGTGAMPGMAAYVFSRTLPQADCPGVTVSADAQGTVRALKSGPGKDIWLFGGGDLFRSLPQAGLVDAVQAGVVPVLLGSGLPLLPTPAPQARLRLASHRLYERTGTLLLEYDVK
jgi:dihydrofolate reductase